MALLSVFMSRMKLFLEIALLVTMALGAVGGEVGDRNMVWAHNTPWFYPLDYPGYPEYYYNFPIQESKDNSTGDMDSLREEIRIAQEKGLDGFFLDFGGDPNGAAPHWSWRLPTYLEAAEGTDFQVALCIDTKISAEYWVKWLTELLGKNGSHPNYPKVGEKFVVCAYQFLHGENGFGEWSWKRGDWRKLHAAMREAGYPIYLIGNVAPLPNARLDLKQLEETKDIYDALFLFDSPAHCFDPPEVNNRLAAELCRKNGKRFLPTLHPGYWGAWLANFNDFYNPFRGFDCFYRQFVDGMKYQPQWSHLTTWNDLVETAVCERLYTFGQAETLKRYANDLKGTPVLSDAPDVLVSYLHEVLPGELLRIEAMSMPSTRQEPVVVEGILRDLEGNVVWTLAPQTAAPDRYARMEWLIPTHELAFTPVLQPEFTVHAGEEAFTRKSIPVYLVSSWLQNCVTVNVPLNRMLADFPQEFKVRQEGNRLEATVAFDSPDTLKRIMLFRNDRPAGVFLPNLGEEEMTLNVIMLSMPKAVRITFENGHLLRAFRKGTQKGAQWQGTIFFDYGRDFFLAADSSSGHMAMALAGTKDLKLVVTNAEGKQTVIPAETLARRRRFVKGDIDIRMSVDNTLFRDEPLELRQGKFTLNFFAPPPKPTDNFYLRFETMDGRYFFSRPIYPFSPNRREMRTLLATPWTLESSKGGTAFAFRGEPEFLTPENQWPMQGNFTARVPVSVLAARGAVWDFDGEDGMILDRYGDRDFSVDPGMLVEDGRGGRALKLDGTRKATLPARLWPMSGVGVTELAIRPEAIGNQPQTIVFKDGWYDGINLNLRPDGKIEVIRCYVGDTNDQNDIKMQTLWSRRSLKAGEWAKIRVEADHGTLRLLIDGKEEGTVRQAAFRSHGNGRVILGGAMPGCVPFRGLVDDLKLFGL